MRGGRARGFGRVTEDSNSVRTRLEFRTSEATAQGLTLPHPTPAESVLCQRRQDACSSSWSMTPGFVYLMRTATRALVAGTRPARESAMIVSVSSPTAYRMVCPR